MSIVVVVGTDSRTLYQSADTNGLLDKLSTFTNWQELVFGSVPLPIPDQVGIKIHPGTITATSILFEYHQLPSSFTIESTASTVIGICVLWSSPLITKKHNHRISCLLENLKCDVERALRDNSHYLLSHLIDEFVRHHQVSPLTSSICSSHTPSLSTCLQFLEPIVGLKLVSDVLTDALVSYYSPRRQKLVIFSQKSSNLLQHLLFTIHHIFVMITSRSDLDRPTKTLHTEPLFIQDDLDEKVTWFDDENVDNSPVNESFSRDCNNSIEPAACSPAFVAENNFIGERAGRIMSSEEESLGYFSSSSSQGSTIAIEGCNNDDVNGNSEIEREICSNFKSLDSCRNDSELLTGQRVVNQDDVVQEATASVKSDGLSSFQEVLREYRDLRFRANTSTLSPKHKSDGRQVFSSRNISTPCIIAVRETDGFLHTFHQSSSSSSSSSYASNTSASSSHPQYLGKMHLLQSDTCTQENVMIHVENLVNLGSHGNYLSPHYLVQGLNMAKGDRIDNHIAYLSRCSCQQCVYSDHSCHFKTLDLDLLTQKNNMSSLTIDGQGFILEILQSALELKKLGLSDDNVSDSSFISSSFFSPTASFVFQLIISTFACLFVSSFFFSRFFAPFVDDCFFSSLSPSL